MEWAGFFNVPRAVSEYKDDLAPFFIRMETLVIADMYITSTLAKKNRHHCGQKRRNIYR